MGESLFACILLKRFPVQGAGAKCGWFAKFSFFSCRLTDGILTVLSQNTLKRFVREF